MYIFIHLFFKQYCLSIFPFYTLLDMAMDNAEKGSRCSREVGRQDSKHVENEAMCA